MSLVLISISMFGQEANWQAMNKARTFVNELNSLVEMQKSLTGETRIRLDNYMMGFAEGAYTLLEEFSNASYSEFTRKANFFFQQYQVLVGRVGARTPNFRNYYHNVGVDRSWWGDYV